MSDPIALAYSRTGASWARGPELVYGGLAEAMVERSPVPMAGRSVVDVGAGTGAGGRAAVAAGASSVVALDAAVGMLGHDAAHRPPATVGDARALPFADGAFDGAVAAFSLNHLRDPEVGLQELARVVRAGGPFLASAYAADDTHPVKAVVESALVAAGWTVPPWYEEVKRDRTPRLATVDGCRAALDAAGVEADVLEVRVPFPDLTPADLVAWRLGMAQCASFVDGLSEPDREYLVEDCLARLGPTPPTLVRSMLVIAGVRPTPAVLGRSARLYDA